MSREEKWRDKYLEAIQRLEEESARWSHLERLLRRIVSRLCLAADGVDERLDGELKILTDIMRCNGGIDGLEGIVDPLSEAIVALDRRRHPRAGDMSADDARPATTTEAKRGSGSGADGAAAGSAGEQDNSRISEALTQLLERMSILPDLKERVGALKGRLGTTLDGSGITALIRDIADLANEQNARIQREKGEIERILQQVAQRLEEIDNWLVGAVDDHKAAQDSSEQLGAMVLGEVKEINTSVQQASDLATLRQKVQSRLTQIGGHFRDFQAREEERFDAWRERVEQMHSRVQGLERETHNLREVVVKERRLAMLDALTGIANRLAYDERLDVEYKRWVRFREPLSIAVWDVDHFKDLNDRYGHKAGDKVLRVLAQFMARNARQTDFIARYGGEEFIVLLVGTAGDAALRVMEGLRRKIETLGFHFRDHPVKITASCGTTEFREGDTPDTAFDRADKALYEAKEKGRNRCMLR